MKVKTSELTGAALDWAVAKCDRDWCDDDALMWVKLDKWPYSPSTDWEQGGPMIERECITVRPVFHAERTENGSDVYRQGGWAAHVEPKAFWITPRPFTGPAPLISAMRCFVASKMGDEVEVPDDFERDASPAPSALRKD